MAFGPERQYEIAVLAQTFERELAWMLAQRWRGRASKLVLAAPEPEPEPEPPAPKRRKLPLHRIGSMDFGKISNSL